MAACPRTTRTARAAFSQSSLPGHQEPQANRVHACSACCPLAVRPAYRFWTLVQVCLGCCNGHGAPGHQQDPCSPVSQWCRRKALVNVGWPTDKQDPSPPKQHSCHDSYTVTTVTTVIPLQQLYRYNRYNSYTVTTVIQLQQLNIYNRYNSYTVTTVATVIPLQSYSHNSYNSYSNIVTTATTVTTVLRYGCDHPPRGDMGRSNRPQLQAFTVLDPP